MKVILVIPFLFLFSLTLFKEFDRHRLSEGPDLPPPLIVSTSLAATLPAKEVRQLKLEHVLGIKVKYATGRYVSYFEYTADRRAILDTLARLPFSKNTVLADPHGRLVSYQVVEQIKSSLQPDELQTGNLFWEANLQAYDVYECLKTPFRHTLLISKNSTQILHRIEFTG